MRKVILLVSEAEDIKSREISKNEEELFTSKF